MQINEQFWGDMSKSQTWLPGVTITNYTMLDAFNESEDVTWTLPLNDELDTSICPWAINKDADILKLAYPVSYRIDTDSYDSATPKFYPVHDYESEISGIPIYFVVPAYTGGGANGFNWYARNGNDVAYIQPSTSTRYRDTVYPVRDFDYSKLCVSLNIVHTDNTTATDSVDSTTFDSYFSPANATWRTTNPIVGLSFRIYGRGWDSSYPDRWQGGNPVSAQQMLMNTMGRKRPCEIAPSDATVGYNVDFKDDFMTLVNGDAWGGLAIGAWGNRDGGNGAAYVLSDSGWALSYEQGAAAELAVSASDHPCPKIPMLEGDDNTHWTIYSKYSGGSRAVYFKTMLDASTFANEDELKAYILKQAAYLGMWIYTNGTPQGDPGSDEHWYLGEIGADGVTTGNYRQGSATSELDNSDWTNPWEDSGWSGRTEDPNHYDDNTTQLNDIVDIYEEFTTKWIIDVPQLTSLNTWFTTQLANCDSVFWSIVNCLVGDPMDSIISLQYYPFNIEDYVHETFQAPIVIGRMESPVSALFTKDNVAVIDAGKCTYYPTFGVDDFRSYAPYSSAELHIPFCGSVNIDPNLYLNHTIQVKYLVDLNSGECLALIYRDNMVVDSISGTISARITMTGADSATYATARGQAAKTERNAKTNGILSTLGSAAGFVGGILTGNPIVAGAGALGLGKSVIGTTQAVDQAEYNLEHIRPSFKVVGTASPLTSMANELRCRLIITRPTMMSYDPAVYAHTEGHACIKTGVIGDFTGYTVVDKVDLSGIPATEDEKIMLTNLLLRGVYL